MSEPYAELAAKLYWLQSDRGKLAINELEAFFRENLPLPRALEQAARKIAEIAYDMQRPEGRSEIGNALNERVLEILRETLKEK